MAEVPPCIGVFAARPDESVSLRLNRVKRSIPAIAMFIVMTLVATWVSFAFIAGKSANAATAKTSNTASVANFVESMKRAGGTHFVLTYRVGGYSFLSYGTIVIAQIPSPPGTKVTTNADGYSGTGRFAYVFHGPTGRIVQWIKNGTNVSACENVLITGTYVSGTFGKLQCSRPSPYIPSNGFAEEDVGFVPTYVLQTVTEIGPTRARVSAKASQEFGPLRCLIQTSGTTTQTTCINQAGFIVSWLLQNGMGSFSRAILSSLKHDPTASDFKTLLPPTKAFILPPV